MYSSGPACEEEEEPIKNNDEIISVRAMKAYWCVDIFHSVRVFLILQSSYTISLERWQQNDTIWASLICGPIQVSSHVVITFLYPA